MSGWTALTLHFDDEQERERVDEELRAEYTGREPYSATGYADATVQVGRHASHEDVATEFANEFPSAEMIAVVSANDTSDSGYGTLYQVTEHAGEQTHTYDPTTTAVEEVDSKRGYEGARGRDVIGYFKEEHGVDSYATWEA